MTAHMFFAQLFTGLMLIMFWGSVLATGFIFLGL
jgi:hypothetical protein